MNHSPMRAIDLRATSSCESREIVEEIRSIRDQLCTFTVRSMRTNFSASETRDAAELLEIAKRLVELADDVEAMERAR